MSNVAIRIENLGKQYRIGQRERYKALRDTLTEIVYAPFRWVRSAGWRNTTTEQNSATLFWALKNVSLEINHGETVGVIGRNGAGKSTLLKILSRITEPTEGLAKIYGRVGSLLEVGTGFHPELTGRENIYLNGAVLGMRKREIESKFAEIVAFAEVEKFMDTPVKHYSSGMYLRLAFAVAAHLETDILLVDEVLAVGDAAFQKKCLWKMGDVAKQGRTILFVSHNMAAITSLCNRAVWLDKGCVAQIDSVENVIREYLSERAPITGQWGYSPVAIAQRENELVITSARVLSDGAVAATVPISDPCYIEIDYYVSQPVRDATVWVILVNEMGIPVFTSLDTDSVDLGGQVRKVGPYRSICEIPGFLLKPGRYMVSVGAGIDRVKVLCSHEDILQFEVAETAGFAHLPGNRRNGIILPRLNWRVIDL